MTSQTSLVAGIAILLAALAPMLAHADPIASPVPPANAIPAEQTAIQAAYDQMNAAFIANHLGQMAAILAPGYTQTDPGGGVLGKSQTVKKLQGERNHMKTEKLLCGITSLKPEGNGVLVGFQMHVSGTGQKKVFFFSFTGTYTYDLVCQDYWIDTPAGWQLQKRIESVDKTVEEAD